MVHSYGNTEDKPLLPLNDESSVLNKNESENSWSNVVYQKVASFYYGQTEDNNNVRNNEVNTISGNQKKIPHYNTTGSSNSNIGHLSKENNIVHDLESNKISENEIKNRDVPQDQIDQPLKKLRRDKRHKIDKSIAISISTNDKDVSEKDISIDKEIAAQKDISIDKEIAAQKDISIDAGIVTQKDISIDAEIAAHKDISIDKEITHEDSDDEGDSWDKKDNHDKSVAISMPTNDNDIPDEDVSIDAEIVTHKDVSIDAEIVTHKDISIDKEIVAHKDVSIDKEITHEDSRDKMDKNIDTSTPTNDNDILDKDISIDAEIVAHKDISIDKEITYEDSDDEKDSRDKRHNSYESIVVSISTNDNNTPDKDFSTDVETVAYKDISIDKEIIHEDSNNEKESWEWSRFLRILGPGIMVCLADTEGPSLLLAAQSGSQYKYSLVSCQLVLIPVLYAAQELTVRLAVCTKQGITSLIREHYGHFWAWFACTLHVLMCWLGQASEFGAIGQLFHDAFGVDRHITNTVQFFFLCGIVMIGRHGFRLTEIVGVIIGSFELVFVVMLFISQAKPREVFDGLSEFHFGEPNYEILMAGNVGAVVMPWMLYYQQSAVCERKIKKKDLAYERADTLIGAILAQIVMTSMVIGMGSMRFYGIHDERSALEFGDIIKAYAQAFSGTTWDSIQPEATSILDVQPTPDPMLSKFEQEQIYRDYAAQIDTWYTPASYQVAKWAIVLGITGACTVASIVLTITSVWSVAEILNLERDLFRPLQERPFQYFFQFGGLVIAYGLSIMTNISKPWFAILTQTINGLLITPVALFLWLLASSPKVMPEEYRLKGLYKWVLAVVFTIICIYCILGMFQEILSPV